MKKWSKYLLAVLLVCAFLSPVTAQAATPYKTYTIDGYGYVTETQTAYTPYKTIEKIGGTMPEDLPTPEKSISQIEREQIKQLKQERKKLMLDE